MIPLRTRCRASAHARSGRPTITNAGMPFVTSRLDLDPPRLEADERMRDSRVRARFAATAETVTGASSLRDEIATCRPQQGSRPEEQALMAMSRYASVESADPRRVRQPRHEMLVDSAVRRCELRTQRHSRKPVSDRLGLIRGSVAGAS